MPENDENEEVNIADENESEIDESMQAELPDMIMIKQQMEELNHKVTEYEDMARRAIAESDNIRKRAEKERREIIKFSNKNLLTSMLGFMDNFERALNSKPDENSGGMEFYKGIEMIHKQFLSFLEENGVEHMDEINAEFNPNIHEAIGLEEDDKYEKETVIEVYSKGYKLNGEILRLPKVRIGKPKTQAIEVAIDDENSGNESSNEDE